MNIIDFHCDTLMRMYDLQNAGETSETLWRNKGQIDIERLRAAGYSAQFFACYLWLEGKHVCANFFEDALAMSEILYAEEKKHPDEMKVVKNYKEYENAVQNHKLAAFLTVEEGGILEGKPERLKTLYDKGIRLITLTWNYENCLGYPNVGFKYQDKGLKQFGIETLEQMDELGIIADVSHLSDGGFYDIVKYGKRPFIASHSNARSICMHPRNLTDDMIRLLAEKGGVAGLNFSGEFLQENGRSTTEMMIQHIRHFQKIGGREIIAIGTDFDGIEDSHEITNCSEMSKLIRALETAEFSSSEIEDICYLNAERFLKRYWEA